MCRKQRGRASGRAVFPLSLRFPGWCCVLVLAGCTRHYRAEGVVLRVDRAQQSITVSHRAIPGYMEAMAMPFRVAKAAELDGLTPGSRIEFRLNVGRGRSFLSHVRQRQIGFDDVPVARTFKKLATGEAVPDFVLTDQQGRAVRMSEFRGRPVAIDFIYTRCPLPEVCPRLSANFALLQKRFGAKIVLLSISIDPLYDTPEVLAEYGRRWRAGPDWHFLTGEADQIQAAAGPYGLLYWPEEGLMTHSSATALIGRDGRLAALVEGSSFTARQLIDLVETVLN